MEKIVQSYGKKLDGHRSYIHSLKHQISVIEKEEVNIKKSFEDDFRKEFDSSDILNNKIFAPYFSRTIAEFSSLRNCYYYRDGSSDRSLKEHLLELLLTGVGNGRVFITLPQDGLPVKELRKFFKRMGIEVQRVRGMAIFIQSIPKIKDDHNRYLCYLLLFRETRSW